ncbi:hypothetical protein LY90DRAFT_518012 [Neocallimastix californiae]|uniref:PLC-like phosphodiesterase n=1 Tax=Neocallimastix californiae TaxID=1754190 RepID=A0A1Y1ZWH3_9FUNG|nr:hypothetical protein LY90DRAFT_518012 [Neocallimastix californiae]|eukprot:ORY14606.1 hypothetical protein LY90DRAFT_518012 [Neocallimastix californiae]
MCNTEIYYDGKLFYTNCTSNSDCLSNKCLKSVCVFNDDNPIVHCDDIYLGGGRSYMYCGKPYHDTCKTDNECSSRICFEDNICNLQRKGPSDSEEWSGYDALNLYYVYCSIFVNLLLLLFYFVYINFESTPKCIYYRQINIPGTHDSGTYAIGKLLNSNIGSVILRSLSISSWGINSRIIEYSKTQDMDITEQLNNGIRYFDIRLSTTDEPFYFFFFNLYKYGLYNEVNKFPLKYESY